MTNDVKETSNIWGRIGKFFLYIGGKLVVVVVAVILMFFCFNTARNSSEVFMVAKDAFLKRNAVILKPLEEKDKELLPGLFTEEYLLKSGLATQVTNSAYTIKNYDERTTVPVSVIFSWQKTAKIRVKNIVQDIVATEVHPGENFTEVTSFIESGIYSVYFEKGEDGKWRINDIVLEEEIEIPEEHVRPIPKPETEEGGEGGGIDDIDEGDTDETQDTGENNEE
ncbi:MAG: hypothetical protein ACOX3W_01515 [Christensenellaceae bacterium]|jgi:hypothetical protein